MLMDWNGTFAKAYQFKPKISNIFIFDHNGDLVHRTFGQEVDEKKLGMIVEKLEGLFVDLEN